MAYPSFPTTHWSLVRQAGTADGGAQQSEALSQLLRQYLPALRAHVLSRWRVDGHRADDLVQGFVCERVLDRALVGRAKEERGRFRNFLMTALDRYVLDELAREQAQVRSPGTPTVPLEAAAGVPDTRSDPSASFDVEWARQVLGRALDLMRQECDAAGRADVWELFHARVLAPLLEHATPVPYEELVGRLRLRSPAQAHHTLTTAKRMFVRLLKAVVAEYEVDADVDQEIADLERILSGPRA